MGGESLKEIKKYPRNLNAAGPEGRPNQIKRCGHAAQDISNAKRHVALMKLTAMKETAAHKLANKKSYKPARATTQKANKIKETAPPNKT